MKFDTSNPFELSKAKSYLDKLSGRRIEIREEKTNRTLSQNKYLHVLFGLYGLEYGWTLEEAKDVIKRELGFVYCKNGKEFPKSTANLSKEDMGLFIDKFRNWSSRQGCYLPSADECDGNIDEYLKRNGVYL